jgi:hypothetical protein
MGEIRRDPPRMENAMPLADMLETLLQIVTVPIGRIRRKIGADWGFRRNV